MNVVSRIKVIPRTQTQKIIISVHFNDYFYQKSPPYLKSLTWISYVIESESSKKFSVKRYI